MDNKNAGKVLITGGSGMIGRHLTPRLIARGYEVLHVGRSRRSASHVTTLTWDQITPDSLRGVRAIVHLAGAGIADKRWTTRRKKEILSSRVDTARLLVDALRNMPHPRASVLVSASGIAYYGLEDPKQNGFVESDSPADDFISRVTVHWEQAVREAEKAGVRSVMIRTGVVLASSGSALQKLALPVRLFVGAPLGSGQQYINWIHINDLCNLYVRAIEDKTMVGPYNAVSPDPVTNEAFTRAVAKVLRRPLWVPRVPGLIIHALLGEVAAIVLKGGKVNCEKLLSSGFEFEFPLLSSALHDLLTPGMISKIRETSGGSTPP